MEILQLCRPSFLFTDSLTTDYQLTTSKLISVITSRNDRVENTVNCCTPIVSVGKCLFEKALLSNGCVYLLIESMLPSRESCFVVCFEVFAQ
jgi:hypothetical protein